MNLSSPSRLIGCVGLLSFALFLLPACSSSPTKTDSVPENTSADVDVGTMHMDTMRMSVDTTAAVIPAPEMNDTTSRLSIPRRRLNWQTIQGPASMTVPIGPAPTPDGKMVFDWPSRMKLNETYLIHLAIACNLPLQYLQEQVDSLVVVDADTAGQHRRRRSKTQVKLGRRMKATLMGASANDSGVTIVRPPDDDGSRTIDLLTDTSVVWSWNVTPHKAGPMKLTMYLTRMDEGDSRPVDVQTIFVEGIPPSLLDQATDLLTKLNAFWALLSTGIGGAVLMLVKYLRDRQSKAKPAPTTAPGQNQ